MSWYKRSQGYGLRNLIREVSKYRGTGGISTENQDLGFTPAFRHKVTGEIFPSLRIDGTPSTMHTFDGIPDKYVLDREEEPWNKDIPHGQVLEVVGDIESGFLRGDKFYTREDVAREKNKSNLQ